MADFPDLTCQVVAGAAAGNVAVSNILLYDRLIDVINLSAAGSNLVAQFKVTADGIINNTGGTVTTGMLLMVRWEQRYRGRSKIGQGTRPSRTPY